MRVAFDATAAPARLTGAGHYMVELVAALDGAGVPLTVLARRIHRHMLSMRAPGAEVVVAAHDRRPVRMLWEQTLLPARLMRLRPDLLHSPHYTLPVLSRLRTVVTFHDATFFTHPELHEAVKVRLFRVAMRVAARRAAGIIAVSEATRAEAVAHTGALPDKIVVIPEGVDHTAFHPPTEAEVAGFRQRHGLSRPYIAFLGTLEPRKNIPRLVAAFGRLAGDWDGALVLAGARGWGGADLERALAAAPSGRVRRLGYIADHERCALLGGAAVVCYPSLAEGFGLPVLEAMACGTPVVTAGVSATAEVAGGAAALADPLDVMDIERALRHVLSDPGYARALAAAGRERAAGYTWERTARETLDFYRRVVGSGV